MQLHETWNQPNHLPCHSCTLSYIWPLTLLFPYSLPTTLPPSLPPSTTLLPLQSPPLHCHHYHGQWPPPFTLCASLLPPPLPSTLLLPTGITTWTTLLSLWLLLPPPLPALLVAITTIATSATTTTYTTTTSEKKGTLATSHWVEWKAEGTHKTWGLWHWYCTTEESPKVN